MAKTRPRTICTQGSTHPGKSNINAWWVKLVSLTTDRALGATRHKKFGE